TRLLGKGRCRKVCGGVAVRCIWAKISSFLIFVVSLLTALCRFAHPLPEQAWLGNSPSLRVQSNFIRDRSQGRCGFSHPLLRRWLPMPGRVRQILSLLALLTCGLPVLGQPNWHERPTIYVPEKPPTKQELQRRESLKQFVLGLLYVREDRLLDAVKALEKAVELDPEATPIYKMLIPFYVALDRATEALKATRKVLEQDPDDFETWFVYARQLKATGQAKEARAALVRGLKAPGIKAHPEVAQPMHLLLGLLHENSEEWLKATAAY